MEFQENDIKIGYEERGRSLIRKIVGEKKTNFLGGRNAMMKLWGQKGLCKVVILEQNIFQSVFEKKVDREKVLQGRP